MMASQMRRRASRNPKASAHRMSRRSDMTRKTAQGHDEDDRTYSITELDQQTRVEVVDRERNEMYSSNALYDILSEDWDSLHRFCDGVGIEYRSSGYSDYDWVRCVDETGECHAETASDMLQMDIYEADDDGYFIGVGMAERYNIGLKKVIALQKKAIALADSPEMDRLEGMGFFDGGDDRVEILDLICHIAEQWYTEDASSFSYAVDTYDSTLSVDGMNDGDVEVIMTLCDRINGQVNEILDEYNETYQSVCQDALDSGIQDIEADENYLTSYEAIVERFEDDDARFTSDGTRVAARRSSGMRAPKTMRRRSMSMRASQMRNRSRTGSFKGAQAFLCDQVADTIDRIESDAPYEDYDALSKAVGYAMDNECTYTYNVRALADHYDVLPSDGELVDLFWDQFYDEVWENIDEDELIGEKDPELFREERRRTRRSARGGRYNGFGTVSSACGSGRKRNRRVR